MPHKSEQIIDAVVALLVGNVNLGARVEKHRSTTASITEGDQPLVVVNQGDDEPDEQGEQFGQIGSLLELQITAYVAFENERDAHAALAEIRRQVHIALMADTSLGLGAWCWALEYGGAEAPVIITNNLSAAAQLSRWSVHYLMSLTDPQN